MDVTKTAKNDPFIANNAKLGKLPAGKSQMVSDIINKIRESLNAEDVDNSLMRLLKVF